MSKLYLPPPTSPWTADSIGKSALVLTVFAGLIWMAGYASTLGPGVSP